MPPPEEAAQAESAESGLPTAPPEPSLPASQSGSGNIAQQAAEEGFEGVEVGGFGTFPMIRLEQGEFLSAETGSLGSYFHCRMMSSKEKFLITNGIKKGEPGADFRYSYDLVLTHKSEQVDDIKKSWQMTGHAYVIKKYLEALVQIVGGQYDGKMVLLSIPPASVQRFSAYWVQIKFRNKKISEVTTQVSKGARVENVKNPFYPWKFDEYVAR